MVTIKSQQSLEDLGLPEKFIKSFNSWHHLYRSIIPLSEEERISRMSEIELLDKQGLDFAEQLKHLIPGGAKVSYFSEGKLKYIEMS